MKKPRTEDLRVRVTREEKRAVERAAEAAGMTASAWVRSLALRAARDERRSE